MKTSSQVLAVTLSGSKLRKNISAITSSSLGNILEWYDFGLFTIFAALFSRLFFPEENPQAALIMTFGVSAAGFVCRPLGAIIFGFLGDTIGRVRTLRISILMISIPTLLIGFLPTYHQAGLLAPILLIATRMWQGISIGGEYSGNFIYLAESAPDKHRALYTSFVSVGANVGFFLAGMVGLLTSHFLTISQLDSYGWRIAYISSGIVCLLVYRFRLNLVETNVFKELKTSHLIESNPFKTVLKNNMPQLCRTLALVCFGTTFYYFCFAYIPVYLSKTHHLTVANTSAIMSVMVGAMIFIVPIGGWLSDHFGRRKMLLFNSSVGALILIPGFYILQTDHLILTTIVMGLFTIISSFEQGTTPTALVEIFPAQTRYTGVSFGFSLGNGVLGGTAPVICAWLLAHTGSPLSPAIYIAACASICAVTTYFLIKDMSGVSLSNAGWAERSEAQQAA